MSTQINNSLASLANIFNLEVISAEINGEPAFALADISDTDKIFYGPVFDGDVVDQEMILDYIRDRFDQLENCDVEGLNLWDRDLLGPYSDGWWQDLFVMGGILSEVADLSGDNIDTISEAAADQVIYALGKIIDEIVEEVA